MYGTHTSSQEPEQLIVDAIKLPYDTISDKQTEIIAKKDNIITNIVSMAHQGETNRIRVCPSNDYILASKSSNNKIYVYNYENVSKGSDRGLQKLLTGHTEEGFGLSWNNANLLASASNDKLVCYWDCNSNINEPISTYTYHTASAEDVAWADDYTIASVGDDRKLILADIRSNSIAAEIYTHSAEVNSIDFNKESPGLIITGSSDQTIAVWDIRNLEVPLRRLENKGEVYSVKWAPFASGIFASTGSDNKVNLWNLGKLEPFCFAHEGHFSRVNEFTWNPTENLVIASVDEQNFMHIWSMHPGFLNKSA